MTATEGGDGRPARIPLVYRRLVVAAAVLAVACSGAWIGLRIEHRSTKDRLDLHELTGESPWPREDLLVPDGLPRDRALGWLDRTGLDVSFDLVIPDGRKVSVEWQMHHPEPDGTLEDAVNCRAVATVTCTELGDGFTFAVSKHAQNSIPSTALLWTDRDRVLSVDGELLELLRRDGYQTDWS
jgi:hypothetical protein